MNNVQLTIKNNGEGAFYIMEGAEQIAKMEVGIRGNILTVYRTEVAELPAMLNYHSAIQ